MSFNFAINLSFFIQTEQQPLKPGGIINGNFQVTVYPQWFKQVSLSWTVPADWGQCLFNVYYSPAFEDDYVKLNATPITSNFFTDTTSDDYSKFKRGYYKVEAILVDKNNIRLTSDPSSWYTAQKDFVKIRSVEIQRREYMLLRRYVGIQSYLFRRKTFGKRCPLCWNYKANTVDDDHCPNCLGTGFDGGFFEPIPLFVQYEATPNSDQKTYFGIDEENQIGGWTISYPDVSNHDILVRTGDWNVYEILKINPTELQGNAVRQILTLTQLSKGSVENKLIARNLPEFPQQFWNNS